VKGTSVVVFRDKALRNGQYFLMTDWSGGKYASPGIEGSRSSGLLAATWASMVSLGRDGYQRYARRIFDTAASMMDAVRSHPELRIMGSPTFCFSFTSDEFDIYHVNDALHDRGWRLNGQQYPNAIHMAVTRPQTRPGVADTWAADLADAVAYANDRRDEPAKSSSIYGGIGDAPDPAMTALVDEFVTAMLDEFQSVPPA
jgi:glutamate/tyrosine decarboxylase-like PLP-dependent enzyme